MSTCRLPSDANLEHLRGQARTLQRRVRAGDPDGAALVAGLHPRPPAPDAFSLSDAQLVIARRYGFPSWPRLRRYVEAVQRYARSPHRQPVDGPSSEETQADDLVRLGTLNYGADATERRERAAELLDAHPELSGRSIATAAATGDVDAARRILAEDPEAARRPVGPFRWEPLLYAAYSRIGGVEPGRSTLDVARLLLEHGADPDAGYLWEGLTPPFTALTGAFGSGENARHQPPHPQGLELARLLLEHGADPNDEQTLYNRHFTPENDHLELLFAHGLGRGDGGPWHRRLAPLHATPTQMLEDQLVFAAANDLPERVELLLRHGVDPDGQGTSHPILRGRSAYELALANGSTRVADLLARAGATVPAPDPEEELLAAAMREDRDRVGALLVAADPELAARARARDPERILKAAELGRRDGVRLLHELGFDVNGGGRVTPLHQAAFNGDRAMVDLLLELGADPTARDADFDATPAGWAQHNGHEELAAALAALEGAR